MHVASRSYLTAGVALVGATTIAVSPIAPPAPNIELPAIHASAAAVKFSALANPIEVWSQAIEAALANANTIAGKGLADPAPIVRQIIANQIQAATKVPAIAQALAARLGAMNPADPNSVPATIQKFITDQLNGVATLNTTLSDLLDQLGAMMDPADPFGIPASIQQILDQVAGGEFALGFTTFAGLGVGIGFPVIMAGFPIASVLSQPFKDLANIIDPTGVASQPLRNLAKFIDLVPSVLPSVLTNSLLGPVNSVGVATAASLEDLLGAAMGADPTALVTAIVNAPAKIVGALLNGYDAPGGFPMAGLLGGPFGISAIGSVLDAMSALANAIASPGATALNAQPSLAAAHSELASVSASPLSSTAKTTVTLDVASNADANSTQAAGSGSPGTLGGHSQGETTTQPATVPSAIDTKSVVDKGADAEGSVKDEPAKTGLGTTSPGETTPSSGAGQEVKDATTGSTTPASGTTSATAGEAGADAGTSSASTDSGSGGA